MISGRQRLDSSCLTTAGYDAQTRMPDVEFRHGGVYRYFEVPASVHESLMKAPSKGRFFTAEVRDRFPHVRLAQSTPPSAGAAPLLPAR